MFEKFKTLKEAAIKLYPYFVPSYTNCSRSIGFFSAVVLVPLATAFLPTLFLSKEDESSSNSTNMTLLDYFASASMVALISGVQQSLSVMLTTSTMQAIKRDNTKILMDDESKFLMHGDNKGVSSLLYVTVGQGPRDFAQYAVPIFAALPMYTISSITTLIQIAHYTGSSKTASIVFGFVGASGVVTYLIVKKYYSYIANNQNIENSLIGKVGFIEVHREAITTMGASNAECASILHGLQKVDTTIPALSTLVFSNTFLLNLATTIASQFLGGYYTNDSIKDLSDPNAKVLNVMILALLTNVQSLTQIFTQNYAYVKLNLDQLKAFEDAYKNCSLIRKTYNKMKQEFDGDHLSFIDFSVYMPASDDIELTALFSNVTLDLLPNKIYKLSAESGCGKTTFMKAIMNNWQYTDGIVKFAASAQEKICFIPQHPFIPIGTIVEILTYPLKPKKFFNQSSHSEAIEEKKSYVLIDSDEDEVSPESDELTSSFTFLDKVQHLLQEIKLMPRVIRSDELESENINWNARLSGGEKQKIGIIRAILSGATYLIMDEPTSALDSTNEKIVYEMVKNYITQFNNYTIIYTTHHTDPSLTRYFADAILTISGQNLECHDFNS